MAANKVLENPAYEVLVNDDTGTDGAVHVSPLYKVAGVSMVHAEVMNNPLFQGSGAELVGIADVGMNNVLHDGV